MADSEYLTPDEFAALTTGEQHAVWKAADAGLVHWVELRNGSPRLYHREDVAFALARSCRDMPGPAVTA